MSSAKSLGGYDGDIKWIPVRAAAKILQVSRQRVSYLCRSGALVSVIYESTRLVSLRSVENRKIERQTEVI
jgi:hypothetical protein